MNASRYRYLDTPIARAYDSGKSIYAISREFGVCPNTIEYRLKINDVRMRSISEALAGRPKSLKHREAVSEVRKAKGVAKGSLNPNWKGGITSKAESLRKSDLYVAWRIRVFQRDDYTCQGCGDNKGGNLEAHHILPRSKFIDQIFVDDNGLTLCKDCHKKVHSKGAKSICRELLETPTVNDVGNQQPSPKGKVQRLCTARESDDIVHSISNDVFIMLRPGITKDFHGRVCYA